MAVTVCSVSGTLVDVSDTAISGATVEAQIVQPIIYGDGTLIGNQKISTTTASDGTWSLSLVENASTSTATRITFSIPDGSGGTERKDYYVVVPAQASATFASLATGQ